MNEKIPLKTKLDIFIRTVQEGKPSPVLTLLEDLIQHIDITQIINPDNGCNALHIAAMHGHQILVGLFADRFPQLVNSRAQNGATPIFLAMANGHINTVLSLYNKGASLALRTKDRKNCFTLAEGLTPEHKLYFINGERNNTYQLLNEGLIQAVLSNNLNAAEQWLAKGADPDTPLRADDSTTALFHANATGNHALAELLTKYYASSASRPRAALQSPTHSPMPSPIPSPRTSSSARSSTNSTSRSQSRGSDHLSPADSPRTSATPKGSAHPTPTSSPRTSSSSIAVSRSRNSALVHSNPSPINSANSSPDKGSLSRRNSRSHRFMQAPADAFLQKSFISIERIKAILDSIAASIAIISKHGAFCIEATNAKFRTQEFQHLCVDPDDFNERISTIRQANKVLHGIFFDSDDSAKITALICKNTQILLQATTIATVSRVLRHHLKSKIPPNSEHQFAQSFKLLFAEFPILESSANELDGIFINLLNDKIELVRDEPIFDVASSPN